MKISKKRLFFTALVILILLSPFALLLNPVLETLQERNSKLHETLLEKKEDGTDVSDDWENLKFRQKLLGDIYRYTFRERKAVDAYETYLNWFQDSWKSKAYARMKFKTAVLCRKIVQENARLREYRKKAACHYSQVSNWYEDEGNTFEQLVNESKHAINIFDLRRHINDCN